METMTSISAKKLNAILVSMVLSLAVVWIILTINEPDLRNRLGTMEFLVLIGYPLVIFYLRSNWPVVQWVINSLLLTLLYVFSASIIHETCHIIGLYAIGSKPIEFSLIPKYWEGQFTKGGWVRSEPINNWLGPIPGLFPYIIDICLIITGFIIFKRRKINKSFGAGFIYVFFCLAPLFDIINNYSFKLIGRVEGNDFHGIALGWGEVWAHLIGSVFSIFALSVSISILIFYKNFPKKSPIDS